jgi:peptidoglycan/xylan/chitin deacetylase (PgdA/CDA1 family)
MRVLAGLLLSVVLVGACQTAPAVTPTGATTPSGSPTPTDSPSPTGTIGPAPTTSPIGSDGPEPSPSGGFVEVTVARGDTLFAIAAANGTNWQSIVFWNKDRVASLDPDDPSYDPNRLEVGWVLLVVPGVTVAYDPTPGGTPDPTTAPTTGGGPSVAIRNGSRTSSMVALTFDMGGRVTPALDIMDLLISRHVKATIFMTGAIIDSPNTAAGRQVLARIAEHPDLFVLGNHSYSHPDFRTLSDAQIAGELSRMEAAVASRSTLNPRPLFRPPYGTYDARVLAAVGAAGYTRSLLWDIDSIDWKPESDGGPTTTAIVSKVRDNVRGGSIILFHLGGYNTLDALPGVLDAITAKGLEPVTIPELLGP